MKKTLFTNLLFAFLITLALISLTRAQQPQTVTDFYLALPNDRYQPYSEKPVSQAALTKYRKSLITTEDVKNGYLKLESNGMEGWTEFALFKKSDGTYIFAISEIGCGPACDGELQMLTFSGGKWTDVTKQFYPTLSGQAKKATSCLWKLPRFGRILIMSCGDDEDESDIGQEFAFEWNGARFVRK